MLRRAVQRQGARRQGAAGGRRKGDKGDKAAEKGDQGDKDSAAEPAAEGEDDGDCKGQVCITKCDQKGRPRDCLEAGEALRMGNDGLTESATRALKYLEKACGLKEREGCYRAGDIYESGGEGVEADVPKAITLLTKACDLGRGDGCDKLSRRAEAGDGMKKDHARAVALLAKGCAAEDNQVWTCNAFKKAYGAKDKTAVAEVTAWKKGCAAKDKAACTALGNIGMK